MSENFIVYVDNGFFLTLLCFYNNLLYSDYNDPWDWPEEDSQRNNGKGSTWLQECCVSLSSTGELLVIAHKNVMIVLTCELFITISASHSHNRSIFESILIAKQKSCTICYLI